MSKSRGRRPSPVASTTTPKPLTLPPPDDPSLQRCDEPLRQDALPSLKKLPPPDDPGWKGFGERHRLLMERHPHLKQEDAEQFQLYCDLRDECDS